MARPPQVLEGEGLNGAFEGSCFMCGSADTLRVRYLRLNSPSVTRNMAYAIPLWLGALVGRLSRTFERAYHPVLANKRFFNRDLSYCRDCLTGFVVPPFSESQLSEYYRDFYWDNRDSVDGHHIPLEDRPNKRQLELAEQRIGWLKKARISPASAIDLGAGDCAATYALLSNGVRTVHVVDPSVRAGELARRYGAGFSTSLDGAPVVDLVFSAHSIEHVADLRKVLSDAISKTRVGGHLFFETPNIADVEVFDGLCHTPHTYLLSERSFRTVAEELPVEIVCIEVCGPEWRTHHTRVRSKARTDLRVLLRRVDGNPSGETA